MATTIRYVTGNALDPVPVKPGAKIVIPHVCNNVGAFGAGFAQAVALRYPSAREGYLKCVHAFMNNIPPVEPLGDVGFVSVGTGLTIANMIAQNGLPSRRNVTPLDYEALADCLYQVGGFCDEQGAEVHAPKFGAGIARGKWDRIEAIINQTLIPLHIPVTVYDLP